MSAPLLSAAFHRDDFDGFIFDCDGTLADSMPLHFQAWTETLNTKLGHPSKFTEELFYRCGGMPPRQIVDLLNFDFGYNLPSEKTAHDKETRFLELLPQIGPVPEVVAVLNQLDVAAKVAVASGGLTDIVEQTLTHLGLPFGPDAIIKFVIGADQVKLGKPHPELFLLTAQRLGVAPEKCLVFEDAGPGFAAAEAAGMKFIDVRPFRAHLHAAARY